MSIQTDVANGDKIEALVDNFIFAKARGKVTLVRGNFVRINSSQVSEKGSNEWIPSNFPLDVRKTDIIRKI